MSSGALLHSLLPHNELHMACNRGLLAVSSIRASPMSMVGKALLNERMTHCLFGQAFGDHVTSKTLLGLSLGTLGLGAQAGAPPSSFATFQVPSSPSSDTCLCLVTGLNQLPCMELPHGNCHCLISVDSISLHFSSFTMTAFCPLALLALMACSSHFFVNRSGRCFGAFHPMPLSNVGMCNSGKSAKMTFFDKNLLFAKICRAEHQQLACVCK